VWPTFTEVDLLSRHVTRPVPAHHLRACPEQLRVPTQRTREGHGRGDGQKDRQVPRRSQRRLHQEDSVEEQDGAETVIMGCAGMALHRKPLQDALGIPVIDPTQAAVAMALGAVQFNRA